MYNNSRRLAEGGVANLSDKEPAKQQESTAFMLKTAKVPRLFSEGDPEINTYLLSQGITLMPPSSLEFHPDKRYRGPGKVMKNLPAITLPLLNIDRGEAGRFRKFLAPDLCGVAPVPKAEGFESLYDEGFAEGAMVRLAAAENYLAITVGLDSGLAIMEALGLPVWFAVTNDRLASAMIPKQVSEVCIFVESPATSLSKDFDTAMKLATRLEAEGKKVVLLYLPKGVVSWAELLRTEGEEAFWEALAFFDDVSENRKEHLAKILKYSKKRNMSELNRAIEMLNRKHFVTYIEGKTVIANEEIDPESGRVVLTFSSRADFRLRYKNLVIEEELVADVWLGSKYRREFLGVTFDPSGKAEGFYNLYKGYAVEPKAGDCDLYWQLVLEVICDGNQQHYLYVRKWLAHMIQKPAELLEVAVVIRGKQGVGKGIFARYISELVGGHSLAISNLDLLTRQFNAHLRDILFVNANEATWSGNRAAAGIMKSIITDPFQTIEHKGRDVMTFKNCKRLLVTSNDNDPIVADFDDRRFLSLVASEKYKEDTEFFGRLTEQMEAGGLNALMQDLLDEDLTGFQVRAVPASKSLFELKLRSAKATQQWLYEKLNDGEIGDSSWRGVLAKKYVFEDFSRFCMLHDHHVLTSTVFGKEVQNLLPGLAFGTTRLMVKMSLMVPPSGCGVTSCHRWRRAVRLSKKSSNRVLRSGDSRTMRPKSD